eukprot:CAMPEP_0118692368 /NCGR_PEP_ID=MMETSP0800-20121206/11238_1 /TAXON_ID=210618 ORGANISM="Striatella unipunctata, Strain CCMP2910" /NCGR_SAMPLE_ID=MMETSP0800 /ASSEMBLY_ACC=CAM_ASM_000638 /LENGTH=185 /DNA_ID=CAMNT_0006590333 /DNA_START=49 /DNA_END=606 /DNA_ORIENTATION=-
MMKLQVVVLLVLSLALLQPCMSFQPVMMASRRKTKREFDNLSSDKIEKPTGPINKGLGQEIVGVSLPEEGKIKGWEFGNNVRMASAQINGNYYAVQGDCPRCGFDLYRGTLVTDQDPPALACPTCAVTYSLTTGAHGPPLEKKGLTGWVNALAKTATLAEAAKNAKAFIITKAENGKVYCRQRPE